MKIGAGETRPRVKGTHCSARGPKFSSYHPRQETHNCLEFWFQELQHPPLISVGNHTYVANTHIDMHTYTHKIEKK